MGPTFVRFQNFGRQVPGSPWWLVMAPGLMLIMVALAILIWPELLAYMVAFVILSLGVTITGWGWRLRKAGRSRANHAPNQGANQRSVSNHRIPSPISDEHRASDTTIYYDHQS